MIKSLTEIFKGFVSLITGLRITLRECFKPAVTVHYPHESLTMPQRFRGHIELVTDPATGQPLCMACKLCEKACPSNCIKVEGAKSESGKRKATEFTLDFTTCSLCGSCVEACKSEALRFSREYNRVSLRKEDFIIDLLKHIDQTSRAAVAPGQAEVKEAGAPPQASGPASSQ